MLTGDEPYEELLKDVRCPSYLAERLRKLWLVSDSDSQYYILNEVVQSLDDDCYDAPSSSSSSGLESILLDTLYRYFVLCGASDEVQCEMSTTHSLYRQSAVWNAMLDAVDLRTTASAITRKASYGGVSERNDFKGKATRRKHVEHGQCIEQFHSDLGLWSIHYGTHPTMRRYVIEACDAVHHL